MKTPLPIAVLLLISAGIVLLVSFGSVPGTSKLTGALQNAGHAPAFFLLAIAVLKLLAPRDSAGHTIGLRYYANTFVVCLLAGLFVEFIQLLTGRSLSWVDIATDTLGIVCGLAGHAWSSTRCGVSRARSRGLLAICGGAALVALSPLAWSVASYGHRNAQFPVIADFDSPLDRYFIVPNGSKLEVLAIDGQAGLGQALRVTVDSQRAGDWPGITLEEPAPDWSGYQTLVIELTNPEELPLKLTLRVHDSRHNNLVDDRYNQTIEIAPLTHLQHRVPIASLRVAPTGREMDIDRIAGIILFGSPGLAGREFLLHRIWLE